MEVYLTINYTIYFHSNGYRENIHFNLNLFTKSLKEQSVLNLIFRSARSRIGVYREGYIYESIRYKLTANRTVIVTVESQWWRKGAPLNTVTNISSFSEFIEVYYVP